ncbi:hypothetical protein EV2_006994 [Malus domestica]
MLKTSIAVLKDSSAAPKLVIDLNSFKGKKDENTRYIRITSAIPKATSSIADRIAQRRSSSVPLMLKFVPKRPPGAKFGSPLERLATYEE